MHSTHGGWPLGTIDNDRAMIPLTALLAMVAALLLLSAGPALSGDFAGTLPSHAHVFLGVPHTAHAHSFGPDNTAAADDVVNVSANEAGMVVLGVIIPPTAWESANADAAPWMHPEAEIAAAPESLITAPFSRPPIS